VDVGRAGDIITAVHDLWSLPLQIVIAFVLLYLQVNVGFLAGVVIILVMIPLNRAIAVRIGTATKELMVHKDARVKLITECFRSIKSIKMSGLEDTMAARSMAHRDQELKYLSQRKYLDAWCVFLWASLPLLVPYLTYVTTVAALNRELSASEVFTTIALLNMLIFPMNAYPWIINGAVEASVSIRRLSSLLVVPAFSPRGNNSGDSSDSEEDQPSVLRLDLGVVGFIREPEIHLPLSVSPSLQLPVLSSELDEDAPLVSRSSLSTIFNGKTDAQLSSADLRPLSPASASVSSPSVISATDFLASWNRASLSGHGPQSSPGPSSRASSRNSSSSTDRLLDQRALVLEDSSFAVGPVTFPDLRPGQVLGICGAVGSGKTTLLMGLLGECYTNLSSSPLSKGSVSFCAQSPRLHAGTVRTNVCFESSYRRERYWMIMRGCCLDEDFCLFEPALGDDIGSSYGMDEEDIGQGGSRLSGGQRLRVGIARALYSSSAVVLLDDPFAALDRKTSERLLAFVLSLAQREKRAVLLVTNEVHMLRTRPRPPSSSTGDSSSGGSIAGISAVVFLSGGRVVGSGSFEELHDSFPAFRGLIEKTVRNVVWSESMELLGGQQGDSDPDPAHPSGGATSIAKGPISSVSVSRGLAGGLGEEEEEGGEHMGRGEIAGHVYRSYFRAAGYGVVALVLFSTLLMQASANGMSFWLAYWSDHLASISDSEFVKISSAIVAFNVLFAFIRSFSFAWGGLIAAKTEYRKLTDATLSTFLHFFETNSLGRIINRFGKDSDIIDDQLPFMLNRILAQVPPALSDLSICPISAPLSSVLISFPLCPLPGVHSGRCSGGHLPLLPSRHRSSVPGSSDLLSPPALLPQIFSRHPQTRCHLPLSRWQSPPGLSRQRPHHSLSAAAEKL
jgi:ATP-binding cassette, subfamily C (CFTR/MRP), member 10